MTNQLRSEYDQVSQSCLDALASLVDALSRSIGDLGVTLSYPLSGRVKAWESIDKKIKRLTLDLSSIRKLDDLIGVRAIVLFKSDVEKIGRIITEHFEIKKEISAKVEKVNSIKG